MPGHGHGQKKGRARRLYYQLVELNHASTLFYQNPDIMVTPHSQSKTWKSAEARDREQFTRLSNLIGHFVPHSPFTPRTFAEWNSHREGMVESKKEDLIKDIKIRQDRKTRDSQIPFQSAFGLPNVISYGENRAAVLSQHTVWSPWYTPTLVRPAAPWPDKSEMSYEGNGRADTRCGRYLPVPRRPGNETATWKARDLLPVFPLDKVGPLYNGQPPTHHVLQTFYHQYPVLGEFTTSYNEWPAPEEVRIANNRMNRDPLFQANAEWCVGDDLMARL